MISFDEIDFSGFDDRHDRLQAIKRFGIYHPMYYRPSVYWHSLKVFWLLRAVAPEATMVFSELAVDRMLVMALVHDDPEIVTGDIVAGNKSKMNRDQLRQVEDSEFEAIEQLTRRYPKTIAGFSYRDLLIEAQEKKTTESQLLKFIDHFDAFCETLHELYAGNAAFATHVINEYGIIQLPAEYYTERFNNLEKYYPLLASVSGRLFPLTESYSAPDYARLLNGRVVHSLTSVTASKDDTYYDWWLKTLVTAMGEQALVEFTYKRE